MSNSGFKPCFPILIYGNRIVQGFFYIFLYYYICLCCFVFFIQRDGWICWYVQICAWGKNDLTWITLLLSKDVFENACCPIKWVQIDCSKSILRECISWMLQLSHIWSSSGLHVLLPFTPRTQPTTFVSHAASFSGLRAMFSIACLIFFLIIFLIILFSLELLSHHAYITHFLVSAVYPEKGDHCC